MPTTSATSRSAALSPTATQSSGAYPRIRSDVGDARRLRDPGGHEVVGPHLGNPGEPLGPSPDDAVVEESQPSPAAVREEGLGLGGIDPPAQEVRDLALEVPRIVLLEREGVLQGRHRPTGRRPLVGRVALGREPRHLPVEHDPAAHLEDVAGRPEEPGVLVELRAAPARVEDDLDARPVARLERPGAEQREGAVRIAQERGAGAEQRAVEIAEEAAHGRLHPYRIHSRTGRRRARAA